MTTASRLKLDVADRVATVTLDRPDRRNALDHESMAEIPVLFDELERRDDVWIIVVTGAGDEAFSAGRDLKSGPPRTEQPAHRMPTLGPTRYPFEAIHSCAKPVIAAVNGWALGGGFELALACDLRVAAEHARFGMPEAKLGLGGQFAGVMLPRLVPAAVANEILYFGNHVTAQQALTWGLVSRVFETNSFRDDVAAYAAELATRAPLTLRRFKALHALTQGLSVEAALRADPFPNPYVSQDAVEGVAAWKEKRSPRWQGR